MHSSTLSGRWLPIVVAPLLLAGCASERMPPATKADVDSAVTTADQSKSEADKAMQTAQQALQTAQKAEQDAQAANHRADKMYDRSLHK